MRVKTNKIFFFTIIIFMVYSCTAKKTIIENKESVKKDTIYTEKIVTKVEKFTDTLRIESPCDSLGNLKPFQQLIKVKQGNIKLTGFNDVISAEIDLNGYNSILERTYKLKYDKFVENYSEENVKYKVPFYHWLIHIICTLVILLLIRLQF